jgi:hypothetical protein
VPWLADHHREESRLDPLSSRSASEVGIYLVVDPEPEYAARRRGDPGDSGIRLSDDRRLAVRCCLALPFGVEREEHFS